MSDKKTPGIHVAERGIPLIGRIRFLDMARVAIQRLTVFAEEGLVEEVITQSFLDELSAAGGNAHLKAYFAAVGEGDSRDDINIYPFSPEGLTGIFVPQDRFEMLSIPQLEALIEKIERMIYQADGKVPPIIKLTLKRAVFMSLCFSLLRRVIKRVLSLKEKDASK